MLSDVDVLVADDSDDDAATTIRALRQIAPDASVVRVKDGVDALHYLFATGGYEGRAPGSPRLILLDVHMPLMDGLAVLKIVRGHSLTEDIPVVLLSSSSNPLLIERARKLGAAEYRVKAFKFERFCADVDQIVRRYIPADIESAPPAPVNADMRWNGDVS